MKRTMKLRLDDLEVATLEMDSSHRGGVHGAAATVFCTALCTARCQTSPDLCQSGEYPC